MTSNTADAMQKEAGGNEFLICHLPTKDLQHQTGCQRPFQREKCFCGLCDGRAAELLLNHTVNMFPVLELPGKGGWAKPQRPSWCCCPCYQLAQVSVLTLCLKKAICNTAGVTSGWEVFETNGLISSFNIPVVLAGLAAMEFNKIDDRQPVRALNSVALIPGFKHDSGILRLPRQCNPHPKYSPVFQGTPAAMQQQVMLTYR